MAYDLRIEIPNEPGALERVAAAVTDAGVNELKKALPMPPPT